MRRLPILGLLPMYLRLYDEIRPETREAFRPWLTDVATALEREKATVVMADICCVEADFRQAIAGFQAAGVDAIVTLHLAYSPSEEALGVLCGTSLPLIMLDTTMDASFGPDVDPGRLMFNHGIHGVQDLAAMLRRWRRPYHVVAGHLDDSDVAARVVDLARAAVAAETFRGSRTVRIGHPFKGMGDFSVPPELLASRFRIEVDTAEPDTLAPFVEALAKAEVDDEIAADRELYEVQAPEDVHRRSVRVGLGLRRYLDELGAQAFSFNFQAFTSDQPPVDTVPFLEASKAMARGVGYAGEGDVLTAALVGALCRGFGMTTFTEIFCPDWQGNSLFLSHMGEINPEVIPGRPPLFEKDYPFSPTHNPAFIAGAPGAGPAVLVNLSPGPDGSFRLILAPVEVLADSPAPAFEPVVRGWIRSPLGVVPFLEAYSRLGGTHHSALVLGDRLEALLALGEYLDLEVAAIVA